jgi:hypothetical protein
MICGDPSLSFPTCSHGQATWEAGSRAKLGCSAAHWVAAHRRHDRSTDLRCRDARMRRRRCMSSSHETARTDRTKDNGSFDHDGGGREGNGSGTVLCLDKEHGLYQIPELQAQIDPL